MGLTINRPGVDPYSNNLLKQAEDRERIASGRRQDDTRTETGAKSEGAVRLSISSEALSLLENSSTSATTMTLSGEEKERMRLLTGELDEIVGDAGGFRKLTETQWERVEEILGEIGEIQGMTEEERARISDLRRVYQLEDELGKIYGDDPGKVLSPEEEKRADEIMLELEELWGEDEGIELTEAEVRQLAELEMQLSAMDDKLNSWTLTPEDEEKANSLFSAMDRIYSQAEERLYQEAGAQRRDEDV